MKRILSSLVITVLLTSTSTSCFAQPDFSEDPYYTRKFIFEVGASFGAMNCLTDLGGGKGDGKKFIKDINLANTAPAGTVYYTAIYKNAVALRTEATWGVAKANDAVLKGVKETTSGRYERNLSFKSTIFEVALLTEIHPRFFKHYTKDEKLPRLSPYVTGGIGYFIFNPQARYQGAWVDLKPLSTEGQGFKEYPESKPYKLKQFNFPVGAGIKYKLTELVNLSAEFVYRILNTDYLDDVSTKYILPAVFANYFSGDQLAQAIALSDRQKELTPTHTTAAGDIRGNPKNNDAYFSINFKVGIMF
jgi:opacity protein-like surface antigen